jgi:hypothetical protein
MSDARAIEAVTETLRSLVDAGVKQVEPSAVAVARPPDRVTDTNFDLQVNLFLYQTGLDGSLRNERPSYVSPGESGEPSLPLILHYLMTPYSKDGNDIDAHRMLGGAVRILHEHTVLSRTELAAIAPYSDIARQVDQVRITWQSLDEKDIYSLWSVFQSPYRLSAAFEVRVVFIDSRVGGKMPLPVLTRGADDRGADVHGDTALPFPSLSAATPPGQQPAARARDVVALAGGRLSGPGIRVRLRHPLIEDPVDVTPIDVTDASLSFRMPEADQLAAGFYAVCVVHVDDEGVEHVTNEVPLLVAPRIASAMPMTVAQQPDGSAVVRLDVAPKTLVGQQVFLLLQDRAVRARGFDQPAETLEFEIDDAEPKTYLVRLRVGGVDSLLVDRSTTPATWDDSQTVEVT